MGELGAIPPDAMEPSFRSLLEHYEEPQRHYHNIQHVLECLGQLDAWYEDSPDSISSAERDQVELALWYHDVIYDARRKDNEAASAQFFAESPIACHLDPDFVSSIVRLIEITDHRQLPETNLERLIVSIDLATLGSMPETYAAYAAAVRREYHWVPEADYQAGRAQVLAAFLERPVIHPEPWFEARYEAKARENLAGELQSLRQ